jgi:heme exporter protein C
MFAYAPFMIVQAPYESTMGLVQKIFYFHFPSWIVMFTAATVCGVGGALYLFTSRPAADRVTVAGAELAVVFGLIGLITGPLWGRKAWGVWWQWDARLTSALVLWLIFVAYLLLGSTAVQAREAVGGDSALRDGERSVVYWSVNVWRTVHPKTTVVTTLLPGMREPLWWSVSAFMLLFILLLISRVRLEARRSELEGLFVAPRTDARASIWDRILERLIRGLQMMGKITGLDRRLPRMLRQTLAASSSRSPSCSLLRRRAQQPPTTAAQEGFVPVDESKPQEHLPAAPLVMTAYAVAWVAIFGYVWSLWSRSRRVEREIAEVSRRVDAEPSLMGQFDKSRPRISSSSRRFFIGIVIG